MSTYVVEPSFLFLAPCLYAKYMFELLYALYCMNVKNNCMHGDLHANNATLYTFILICQELFTQILKIV